MSCTSPADALKAYSVPTTQEYAAGQGAPRRSANFKDSLIAGFPGINNLHENLLQGAKASAGGPFLGYRSVTNGTVGDYSWISYDAVVKRVKNFASWLITQVSVDENVGLFSINRSEWVIAEHACYAQSLVTVPLYDTLGEEAIEFIVNQTSLKVIVCSGDKTGIIVGLASKIPTCKVIVCMDKVDDAMKQKAKDAGIDILSMTEAEASGEANPKESNPMRADGFATICYTSGVQLTHTNILAAAGSGMALMTAKRLYQMSKDDIHISYCIVVQVMICHVGARCGFYQGLKFITIGDTLKLLDDVAVLKPSVFVSVPRLYNRIYDKINAGVAAKGGVAAALFKMAYEAKLKGLEQGTNKHWLWDRLVFGNVRARLGGNVKMMITGAAPISAQVVDFLRICFSVDLFEGYGQTETAAALSITDIGDMQSGHAGSPFPCCEVKLVDVPEMNYTSTDKPCPRGEICVRGHNVFSGYYKNPEKTAETIDSDGWCHTGDIGMWDEKGRLKIVDRLAQGEYIAPEKCENVYGRHELVAQSFVYGDSLQSTLVGVIVPDFETLKPWAIAKGFGDKSLKEYCADPAVVDAVFKELAAFAKKSELKGFECLKKVVLYHEQFSMANDLLTPTFKLKRHQAKIFFQKEIDTMYEQVNAAFAEK